MVFHLQGGYHPGQRRYQKYPPPKLEYNLLTIVTGKTLYIYKYDFKKLTDPITPFKKIGLDEKPVLMQIVKDGNICLFFSKKMEVFLASD